MRPRVFAGGAVALALSGVLHAAVLLIAAPKEEPVLITGGGTADIAALGAAFEDFVAGAVPVTQAAQPAVQVPATQPTLSLPASDAADLAVPVTAQPSVVPTATVPVTQTASSVAPQTTTAIAEDTAPVTSVRPVARPDRAPQQRAAQAAPAQPAGNAQADANRGSAQGQQGGQAAASGEAPAQDTAGGQAAAANYPGQVLRQITRQRRQTAPSRGTVLVSFQIGGAGTLVSVAVARSSGSPALDQMAMDHIQRSAPFPPPPAGAQTAFSFEFVGRS